MKKKLLTFLCFIAIIAILLFPKIVTAGMKQGILLSLYSVVPALMPFMIITNIMIKYNLCFYISRVFHPLLKRIFKVSYNGCFAVIIGFTCGYPMGSKTIGSLYEQHALSLDESKYLITFCNNASLSFLTNYVAFSCLKSQANIYLLLLLVYLPPVITGILNGFFMKVKPSGYKFCETEETLNPLKSSLSSISVLCLYVICFNVISTFIMTYCNLPLVWKSSLLAFMEITSGCNYISGVSNYTIKIFIVCLFIVFGSISIMFQSFAQLSIVSLKKWYIIGKLEQIVIYLIIFFIILSLNLFNL